ncbi:MAG: universal stress protein [Gammaproteobacteria bacterium]|nr:universal stress protein [Gammaproteobacteria bacterium]
MFKNILIPTDGSELSEKVVTDGVRLAKILSAKIVSIHVMEPAFTIGSEFGAMSGDWLQQYEAASRKEGNAYLDRIETAARVGGVAFDRVLVERVPTWKAIVETAKQKHCDLIMMAAHGRRGIAALVLGSVTNQVLTHSSIPVLVYR